MNPNNTFLRKMLMLRPPEASCGITALETQRTQKEQMSSSCVGALSV